MTHITTALHPSIQLKNAMAVHSVTSDIITMPNGVWLRASENPVFEDYYDNDELAAFVGKTMSLFFQKLAWDNGRNDGHCVVWIDNPIRARS